MKLTGQHIDEFIEMYRKRYGVVLGRDEALKKGLRLCRLLEIVLLENDNDEYGETETRLRNGPSLHNE